MFCITGIQLSAERDSVVFKCINFSDRGYLNIESGFELGLEPGLEPGLELGLEPGLEAKMTSSDFDGRKFTNSVLTFK